MKTTILAGVLSLFLFAAPKTNLTDISKPHLGVYDCKKAQLGSRDMLSNFTLLRLELVDEENYRLCYGEKNGERKSLEGKYTYDVERGVIIFQADGGIKREFPFDKGKLTVTFPVGNVTAILQFERP